MIALSWRGIDADGRAIWLGMSSMLPAMYMPFLVLFLPRSDQPNAAWLFESAPLDVVATGRSGAMIALTTHVLLPAQVLTFCAMLALRVPWVSCATIATGSFAIAVGATHLATQRLTAVPFTQTDEASGAGLDSGRVLALSLLLGGVGAALGACSHSLIALAAGLVFAVFAVTGLVLKPRA